MRLIWKYWNPISYEFTVQDIKRSAFHTSNSEPEISRFQEGGKAEKAENLSRPTHDRHYGRTETESVRKPLGEIVEHSGYPTPDRSKIY